MNKLSTILLASLAILSSACAVQKPVSALAYTLTGTIAGAEDGTWIYLVNKDRFNRAPLSDSTQLQKGKFAFTGTVPHDAMLAMVGIKGPVYTADGQTVQEHRLTDATVVWLENKPIKLEGTKGELHKARVSSVQSYAIVSMAAGNPAFIREHAQEYFSAYLLNVYKESWGREQVSELYGLLGDKAKGSLYGQQVAAFLAATGQ